MPGSRSVVLLALASVLVVMLAAAGWCGGPVTGAPGAGYQPDSRFIPRGGETGPATGGNFSMAGNVGSGTVNGSHGFSPWVEFGDLGFKSDVVWGARARFEPNMLGLALGINGEFLHTEKSATESSYSGDYVDGVFWMSGASYDSKFQLTLISVTADIGLAQSFLGRSGVVIAPRVGWTQYIDRAKATRTGPGPEVEKRPYDSSIAMFTAGLAGRVSLKRLAGGLGDLPGPVRAVEPVVSGVWMIGDSKGLRYYQWEAWVGIFATSLAGAFDGFPIALPTTALATTPSIGVELGWVHYQFIRKGCEEGLVGGTAFAVPVWARDRGFNYRLDIPTVRAVVAF